MKLRYIYILLIPCFFFSQEDNLRFEIIDVFQNYSPVIANSVKIDIQPIYNDTLQEKIISNKPILSKNLFFRELIHFKYPTKFLVNQLNSYMSNYASVALGSYRFLNAKLHYNNGLSVRHNSGFYCNFSSEDYSFISPYYKNHNGDFFREIKFYTTRFLNNKVLQSDFQVNSMSGLYWGGLQSVNEENIDSYKGSNIAFNIILNQNSINRFFQSADFSCNYFLNNHNRKELFLESSVHLQTIKSLKKYSLALSSQLVKSVFDHVPVSSISTQSNVSSYVVNDLNHSTGSDMSIRSQFLLSGNKEVDYHAGLNISYGKLSNQENSKFLFFPTLKLFKKIGASKSIEFEFNKQLKYHYFSELFVNTPFVDPYFRNFFSQEFKTSFSYKHLFTEDLSFHHLTSYNVIEDRAVPFLYELYDISSMNPLGIYLTSFKGFDFVSSLSWSWSQYDFMLSLYLNSMKANEHLNKSFVSNKINTTIMFKLLNTIDIVADCYYVGDKDALRLSSTLDDNVDYVALQSYLSANLSVRYMFQNMIFSVDFRNLLNQKYNTFDGYSDDDGFKFRLGFVYRF